MQDRDAYIALNMMERIGPVTVRSCVDQLGSAAAIFDASEAALQQVEGLGRETLGRLLSQRGTTDWQAELDRADEAGARLITPVDDEYPGRLKTIHDPPLALYIRGELRSVDAHAIAVVGTRHPTHYGTQVADSMAFQLAQAGYTVSSGLAEGIDTAAHEGALKAKGRTVAVIGSALDELYPKSNEKLADRIAGEGAVISEFPFGRKPDKTTFPMRNRIVSGMSKAILVVEAGPGSGALITADLALEQGRDVFAVPGRIDSRASRGCHSLIRNGATLVTQIEDIISEYEDLFRNVVPTPSPAARAVRALTTEEQTLVRPLEGGDQNVDSLIRLSGLPPADVNVLLLGLEMKKVVKLLPGRMVTRVGAI